MELLNDGVWRASRLVNTSVCQKGAHPSSKETEAPVLRTLWIVPWVPRPLAVHFYLYNTFSNKPVNVSEVCSWVLWVMLTANWTWGRDCGKLIYSSSVRGMRDREFAVGIWSGNDLVDFVGFLDLPANIHDPWEGTQTNIPHIIHLHFT